MNSSAKILDFPFSSLDSFEIVNLLQDNSLSRRGNLTFNPHVIHFLNAFCITQAKSSRKLEELYNHEVSINVIDGASLLIVQKLMEKENYSRIRGTDFVRFLFNESKKREFRIGLIGGSETTISQICENLALQFPRLRLDYIYTPPFSDVSLYPIQEIAFELVRRKIDICLVGIGTPKQDELAHLLADLTFCDFACIGAALNYVSGLNKESPKWISTFGFEWLFRLLSEPRRLWRRYVLGVPRFISLVIFFYTKKISISLRRN
jgi:N-acetylglucosaminyldiphosphoundecaprenol N-acetyl-beta-D-mannosaminyltransferase